MSAGLVPLRIGDAVVHVAATGTTEELGRARRAAAAGRAADDDGGDVGSGSAEIDLSLIERRCRLKAESCRVYLAKQVAAPGSEAEFDARRRMDAMIAQAKSTPNCFLWVFWRERTQPDAATLHRIAECYGAMAEATGLMQKLDSGDGAAGPGDESEAMELMAEASSALRQALRATWLTSDDHDQAETHLWLRRETALRRVYVRRHMSLDDPAHPAGAADLRRRIQELGGRLDEQAQHAKLVRKTLSQIRYHAGQITRNPEDDPAPHWAKIADGVMQLGTLGVPPTDPRIGAAIGPQVAALHGGAIGSNDSLHAALAAATALAAPRADGDSDPTELERAWSSAVLEVRTLLRGRRIVLVGGQPYPDAGERLQRAFELADLEWVHLTEHGSGEPLRAPISRPDTALVVVIIKLTGHLHVDEAKSLSAAAGKPCVLLTGGYNPERVAHAVLEQASARLREEAETVPRA